MGQLNLQHGKGREGRGQQATPDAVEPAAQQKEQIDRTQIGQGHERPPDFSIAPAGLALGQKLGPLERQVRLA